MRGGRARPSAPHRHSRTDRGLTSHSRRNHECPGAEAPPASHGVTSQASTMSRGGAVAPARAAAAGPDLHDLHHADPVPADHRDLHAELERAPARGEELPRDGQLHLVRVARQLRDGVHRHPAAARGDQHRRADRLGGGAQLAARAGPGGAARPEVPRPRDRADPADRAVPGDAGRLRAGLEARALQPGLRPVQRRPELDLAAVRRRAGPGHRLRVEVPDAGGDRRAGVAVDAVHDADPAGRAAVPARGRARGREDRPRRRPPDLPLHHAAAPAPVHRAVGAARLDLRRCRPSTRSSPSPRAAPGRPPPTCPTRST